VIIVLINLNNSVKNSRKNNDPIQKIVF